MAHYVVVCEGGAEDGGDGGGVGYRGWVEGEGHDGAIVVEVCGGWDFEKRARFDALPMRLMKVGLPL